MTSLGYFLSKADRQMRLANGYSAQIRVELFIELVNIPDIQRDIDDEHVARLEAIFREQYKRDGFVDTERIQLTVFDDSIYVIDGQHRVCALRNMKDTCRDIIVDTKIRTCATKDDMNIVYRHINNSKPITIARSDQEQCVINNFSAYLHATYPSFVSTRAGCHRPNFRIDDVRAAMNEHHLIERLGNPTCAELVQMFRTLNQFYAQYPGGHPNWGKWGHKIPPSILQKITCIDPVNPCLIGMFPKHGWMVHLLNHVENRVSYHDMNHTRYDAPKRQPISQQLRETVWLKRNASPNGKCYCCDADLVKDNMESGHIVSVHFGGDSVLSNLEPICSTCNRSMGTENLNRYKTRVYT